jgi:hypothetical protein
LARRKGGLAVVALLVLSGGFLWYRSDPLRPYRRDLVSALQAVQELRAATRVGVTQQEYSKRLIDTQIRVDRALQGIPTTARAGHVSLVIRNAMDRYKFADEVWGIKIQYSGVIASISDRWGGYPRELPHEKMPLDMTSPFIETCPAVKAELEAVPLVEIPDNVRTAMLMTWGYSLAEIDGAPYQARWLRFLDSVPGLWGCASDEIAIAEAALNPGARQ